MPVNESKAPTSRKRQKIGPNLFGRDGPFQVSAPHTIESDDPLRSLRRFFERRSLAEGTVGPMLVVMNSQ